MIGQEKSPLSESLAAEDNGLGFENLNDRLQRYAVAKERSLRMSDYIRATEHCNNSGVGRYTGSDKLAAELRSCGSYLIFKHYYQVNEVRLHAMKSCRKHMLCPFCAIRRGAKYVQAYHEKLGQILADKPNLRAFMVTLTVKDGENLVERFNHLRNSLKRYQEQRRNALKGQRFVEYAKALGGVFSIEIKRGSGSGIWHPHCHMIWLCEDRPDPSKLSDDWFNITGDSYIVDVREFYGESVIDGFLEVFKYALKFSEMELSDNLFAYRCLNGKRFVDSFGLFRGVVVPDKLTDDDIDSPYNLLFFKFLKGRGYNFERLENSRDV